MGGDRDLRQSREAWWLRPLPRALGRGRQLSPQGPPKIYTLLPLITWCHLLGPGNILFFPFDLERGSGLVDKSQ